MVTPRFIGAPNCNYLHLRAAIIPNHKDLCML